MEEIKKIEDQECSIHHRKTEVYCTVCKELKNPMCPICICSHNQEKHSSGSAHITVIISEGLDSIQTHINHTPEDQEKLQKFRFQLAEIRKVNEETREAIDSQLISMKEFCETEGKASIEQNEKINQFIEKINTKLETLDKRLETRKGIPKELKPKVDALVEKREYWEALELVDQKLKEDVVIDDGEVNNELINCKDLSQQYEQELTTVKGRSIDPKKLDSLVKSNEDLKKELEKTEKEAKEIAAKYEKIESEMKIDLENIKKEKESYQSDANDLRERLKSAMNNVRFLESNLNLQNEKLASIDPMKTALEKSERKCRELQELINSKEVEISKSVTLEKYQELQIQRDKMASIFIF